MKSIRLLVNGLSLCLIVLGLASAQGCRSTSASEAIELRLAMTSGGQVLFDGNSYDPGALPAALKARGVPSSTSIAIAIPQSAPMDIVKAYSSRLASAGYHRFVFVRPKHAAAAPTNSRKPWAAPR